MLISLHNSDEKCAKFCVYSLPRSKSKINNSPKGVEEDEEEKSRFHEKNVEITPHVIYESKEIEGGISTLSYWKN